MYIIFVGMIVSFFLNTIALGMTEQKDCSSVKSLEAEVSQLSLDSAAGMKTGDSAVAGGTKAQDPKENKTETLVLPDKETYWDHAKLKFFMRGDGAQYIAMFKKAVEEKNAVLQVALTNAYKASMWDHDTGKQFKIFCRGDFKNYVFSLWGYELYGLLYRQVFFAATRFEITNTGEISEADAKKIYQEAAAENFMPAMLTIMTYPGRSGSPARANREILGKLAASKDPEAMLLYGKMLFWGNESKSPEEKLQGLQYMHASGLLDIREDWGSGPYEDPTKRYEDQSRWCDYQGMRLFKSDDVFVPYQGSKSDLVLVPSQGYLEEFCGALVSKL